ncbi:MAG: acyl-CoA dehydrogenase [Pseudomonadota bacterium]
MYRAPVSEISHTLKHVAGLKSAIENGELGDLSEDLVDAVLEEAGKFASDRIAPLNRDADLIGAKHENGVVTTPPGFKETYKAWTDGGWNAIAGPEEYGGQGLPNMLSVAAAEMWNSASMAFGLCPLLTIGAIEALDKHGSQELKDTYLENLISGKWTGTMNLTEPQCGSDLAALKTSAKPVGDGTYKIYGQKIFITFGEHDMAENICHLVLARLPDAPAGTRGISLFLVPKFLVNNDGSLGERNDVFCQSIEHKIGIHGSPTCVMIYGDGFEGSDPGAIGYLIGEENRGLNCMFTMMNNARLNVGTQGVSIGEAAYQHALAYANDRKQGKAADYTNGEMAPIIYHPDVQRNLLTMKSMTEAARGICYSCAHALDMAQTKDGDEAKFWSERGGLLTPIAKAFATDVGCEAATIGVQIHGGMGFIEETGAAQFMRDGRINPIYEGTNGIQSIDLVTRKLPLSGGDSVKEFITELRGIVDDIRKSNRDGFGQTSELLDQAINDVEETTNWLMERLSNGEMNEALAGATPYLRQFGITAGGCYLAKSALASDGIERIGVARFFAENFAAECAALKQTVTGGAESLLLAGGLLKAG